MQVQQIELEAISMGMSDEALEVASKPTTGQTAINPIPTISNMAYCVTLPCYG